MSMLPAIGAASDYQAGLEAVEKGAYASAKTSFLKSALRGHADSQRALGTMALTATDQPPNYAEALGWLLAAQENGASNLDSQLEKAREAQGSADPITQQIVERYGRDAIRKNWLSDSKDQRRDACKSREGRGDAHNALMPRTSWQHAALGMIERSRTGRLADFHSVFRFPAKTNRVNEELFLGDVIEREGERARPMSPSECWGVELLWTYAESSGSGKHEIIKSAASRAENGDAEALYTVGMALNVSRQPGGFDLVTTAAQAGHPEAQYYVSKHLADRVLARKWLELAAEGVPAAQIELAEMILASDERSSQLQRVQALLEQASKSTDEYVMARIAAIRAAAPDEQLRDAQLARKIARRLDLRKWPLPIRFEAVALSFAAAGDFGAAVKMQNRALRQGARMGYDMTRMEERMKMFQAKTMWFGYLATEYQ